jgi:hypothetical protein
VRAAATWGTSVTFLAYVRPLACCGITQNGWIGTALRALMARFKMAAVNKV